MSGGVVLNLLTVNNVFEELLIGDNIENFAFD